MQTILNKTKTYSDVFTHVDMVHPGKYVFDRNAFEDFMSAYSLEYTKPDFVCGVAERSTGYTMLRVDIDRKIPGEIRKSLYDIAEVHTLITQIQTYLKQNICDYKHKHGDCAILTKDPYIKIDKEGTSFIKHGFHLQFPNCFLCKDDFQRLETHFHSIYSEYDKICSHPWLLYGSRKTQTSGSYEVTEILKGTGATLDPKNYFKKYTIYNKQEKPIKYTRAIHRYYPQIFSIRPWNRPGVEFKEVVKQSIPKEQEQIDYGKLQIAHEDVEEYSGSITEIIENYIDDELYNALEIKEVNGTYFKLRNTGEFTCPIDPSQTHSRLGAFCNIRNGGVYFGCYKCKDEGRSTKFIGKYKETIEETEETEEEKEKRVKADIKRWRQANIEYQFNHHTSNTQSVSSDYVNSEHLNADHKCIVIRAPLGRGKSTAVSKHIDENDYDRIIVLTPRITYATSVIERLRDDTGLEWKLYRKCKGVIGQPYIVIQAESLHRLELDHTHKVLLVMDECESFLNQLTSTSTHGDMLVENMETFHDLLRYSTKILCLDAFVSQRTIQLLDSLEIDHVLYNYNKPLDQRTCIECPKDEEFVYRLVEDLRNGKNVYLFVTSNNKLVNVILPMLLKEIPDLKYVEYHGKKSDKLNDVKTLWKSVQLVCVTSSMTVGVNFDEQDHFHKVYVHVQSICKNLVRDIFQSSYRVRHLIDNEMIYRIDSRQFGIGALHAGRTTIAKQLKQKEDGIIRHYEKYANKEYEHTSPDWVMNLAVYNQYEANLSILNANDVFQRYLKECNYVHNIQEEEMEFDPIDEVSTLDIKYVDIAELTQSEVKRLLVKRKSEKLEELELICLEKFFFKQALLDISETRESRMWQLYRKKTDKAKFKNIMYEKGYWNGSVRIQDMVNDTLYACLTSRFPEQLDMITQLCKRLGMKHTHELSNIDRSVMQDLIPWLQKNRSEIHTLFGLRDQSKNKDMDLRSAIDTVNKVFASWGFTSLVSGTRKQARVNGKVVDVSPFKLHIDIPLQEIKSNFYDELKPKIIQPVRKAKCEMNNN